MSGNAQRLKTVIPLRPLEMDGVPRPDRTIFYHELQYGQGIELRASGRDALQRVKDIERLIEVITMIKRWADEDGTFLKKQAKEQAAAWWKEQLKEMSDSAGQTK